jgi:SNW domain-containing protein 1
MNSGFDADDAAYNIYDKALFKGSSAADAIYRPTRTQEDEWGDEDVAVEKVAKASRFKPGDRGFEGAGGGGGGGGEGRGKPVEFEAEDAADPFGLNDFLSEAKEGNALDKIGEGGGSMGASAGGSMGDSGRSNIGFQRGGA